MRVRTGASVAGETARAGVTVSARNRLAAVCVRPRRPRRAAAIARLTGPTGCARLRNAVPAARALLIGRAARRRTSYGASHQAARACALVREGCADSGATVGVAGAGRSGLGASAAKFRAAVRPISAQGRRAGTVGVRRTRRVAGRGRLSWAVPRLDAGTVAPADAADRAGSASIRPAATGTNASRS